MTVQQLDGGLVPQGHNYSFILLLAHFFLSLFHCFTADQLLGEEVNRQLLVELCPSLNLFAFDYFSYTLYCDIFFLFLFTVSLQTSCEVNRRLAAGATELQLMRKQQSLQNLFVFSFFTFLFHFFVPFSLSHSTPAGG